MVLDCVKHEFLTRGVIGVRVAMSITSGGEQLTVLCQRTKGSDYCKFSNIFPHVYIRSRLLSRKHKMAEVKFLKGAFLETEPLDSHGNDIITVTFSEVFPRSPTMNSEGNGDVTEVGGIQNLYIYTYILKYIKNTCIHTYIY